MGLTMHTAQSTGAEALRASTATEIINRRLASIEEDFVISINRLDQMLERLHGPAAKSDGSVRPAAEPLGSLAEISSRLDRFVSLGDYLRNLVERAETVA